MSVHIELNSIRLVDKPHGNYEVQELGIRGPRSKNPGVPYVRKRHSCSGLGSALETVVNLWPQRDGAEEIRTLNELARSVAEIREVLQGLFTGAGPRPLQAKCGACGRFFSWRSRVRLRVGSEGLEYLCPGCAGEGEE